MRFFYIRKGGNIMYDFEKDLANNEMSMKIVNARRFGAAVRKAMRFLEDEAHCYYLLREPYYQDTKAFLEQMAARLEADPQQQP